MSEWISAERYLNALDQQATDEWVNYSPPLSEPVSSETIRLTESEERAILARVDSGMRQSDIAREFGITGDRVFQIKRRRNERKVARGTAA